MPLPVPTPACRPPPPRPVGVTPAEVLPLADKLLVELSGEQEDFGLTDVMAKRAAGEADLLAAAGDQ